MVPELIGHSDINDNSSTRWVNRIADADDNAVRERDELNQLREATADVTRQRDVLKRTAANLIQEGTNK